MFSHRLRPLVTGMGLILALVHLPFESFAISISTRYRSPRNPERKVRQSTELIVLHTTEAPARSSLNKLCDRGEAHFCVTEDGGVYQIVDRDREAFHAGRSMWNGKEDVDKFSIGIECVGYHDKKMPLAELTAIRELVKELQRMYRIPDERVVCHSHVAYGSPNKWQKCRHRGRKRCGMLFAMPSVRKTLDLKNRPTCDQDTRCGRLTIGDDYLHGVLYGRTDTMVGKCGTPPVQPRPVVVTRPSIVARPAVRPPPSENGSASTSTGPPKSIVQLRAMGFVNIGSISKTRSASKIAGSRWNSPDTYYTIRDKVIPGNVIDAARMEKGMSVWRKK